MTTLGNLATLYQSRDRFAEAEPLLTRLLSMAEKTYEKNDPQLSGPLQALVDVYAKFGREKDAKRVNDRALKLKSR